MLSACSRTFDYGVLFPDAAKILVYNYSRNAGTVVSGDLSDTTQSVVPGDAHQ